MRIIQEAGEPSLGDAAEARPRIAAVDGLRGLLALTVVLWHVCSPFGANWMLALANLAVGLFFVLSGYALTRSWNGRFIPLLVRRLVRLWPTYALCLGAGYVIAGAHPVWSEFVWYPILGVDAKPQIDPPVWSLFLEVWITPFVPLIAWAGSGPLMRALLVMSALLIAQRLAPQIAIAALFVGGAACARYGLRNRMLEAPVLQWLGRLSYSLYLSHWLVLSLATRTLGPWGGVIALPAIFAVAWLIWLTVERPSLWLARSLGKAPSLSRLDVPNAQRTGVA
ncbi:MAG: acyltransferase family protein [Caulobacteraceae bacterium]|nr:acyltransferase family protein [Caulobacteraceae bacterium]